jgi:ParB-like chromosome segregation protein Spo0J
MLDSRLLEGKVEIKTVPISSLVYDPNNARKHSPQNLKAIANSLEKFGQRKPIVVHNGVIIAGNGTVEAARSLDWTEITITEVPSDWDVDKAKAFAIADNRTAELAEWDTPVLVEQLLEMENEGWDLKEFGFDDGIMESLQKDVQDTVDKQQQTYSNKMDIPQYQIVGAEPAISELFNSSKADRLKEEINESKLTADIKEFLLIAANRHVQFDYKQIAEFYPHQTPEIQKLMEESALVIIDADDAIRNGYANFLTTIAELEQLDGND